MLGEISSIITIWDASVKVCKTLEDKLNCYNYIVNLSKEYIKLCEEFKVKDLEIIKEILKEDKIRLLEKKFNEASGDELKKY